MVSCCPLNGVIPLINGLNTDKSWDDPPRYTMKTFNRNQATLETSTFPGGPCAKGGKFSLKEEKKVKAEAELDKIQPRMQKITTRIISLDIQNPPVIPGEDRCLEPLNAFTEKEMFGGSFTPILTFGSHGCLGYITFLVDNPHKL